MPTYDPVSIRVALLPHVLLRARVMKTARYTVCAIALTCFVAFGWPAHSQESIPRPVLVIISIDGLHPDYVIRADTGAAHAPNLHRFLQEGAYATRVRGVVPTYTYPSHATLLTGVSPAKHGISSNLFFDPTRVMGEEWYWYAEDIKARTLWDAAAQAGRSVANLHWPTSVGATSINWNIPDVGYQGTARGAKLLRALSTPGLLREVAQAAGPYIESTESTPEMDETRARYAAWVLENKRPDLLTIHFDALDAIQHAAGPFTDQSLAILKRMDALVGLLRVAAESVAHTRTYVAVVSDHGLAAYRRTCNLHVAFRTAGLLSSDDSGRITDWKALPWVASGSAAIILRDTNDAETQTKVRTLLSSLARNPEMGIDRILEGQALKDTGGFPEASFVVGLKPEWQMGTSLDGPVVRLSTLKPKGQHGLLPDYPEMSASFFIVGPGVPAGKNLGELDMRDIAPTLGARMNLSLPEAEGKNVL